MRGSAKRLWFWVLAFIACIMLSAWVQSWSLARDVKDRAHNGFAAVMLFIIIMALIEGWKGADE